MTALDEQETTFTVGRTEPVVRVWTSDTRHLRRLRKLVSTRDFVRELRGGSDWGEFECDIEFFHVFSAFRAKRAVSEATRASLAARLAAHREAVAS